MDSENKIHALRLNEFERAGLYLILPDSTRLELTRENIEKATTEFWQNPSRITPEIRKAIDFQKCYFCPHRGKEDMCDSIRPLLPFLDIIDKYVSFDKVIAVYREKEQQLIHATETSMQDALQYVSILSLLNYNLVLRKYWNYYYGVIPLMRGKDVAVRVYLNMYWAYKGDKDKLQKIIVKFKEELRVSSDNQVKRLNLICKNDAFMNAFVNTTLVAEFLSMDIEQILTQSFEDFEKELIK
ncbi:hypothetical protein ACFL0T_01855 [Candidatus Omnitrophota bacterium]